MLYLQFMNKTDISVKGCFCKSHGIMSNRRRKDLPGSGCGTAPAGPLSVLGTVFPPS